MASNVPEMADIEPVQDDRGLPVYLLLDTSGSMTGKPIEAVAEGVERFKKEVAEDPFARETVKVGVITFSDRARLVTGGLLPIGELPSLDLQAGGYTRLDLAFAEARESIDKHVVAPVKGGRRGDWKPVLFVLTDGRPTDEHGYQENSESLWKPERQALLDRPRGAIKVACIVAVGCGPHVDDETLKEISTGPAFRISGEAASFVALFKWLSQSVTRSVQPGGNPEDPFSEMEPPPDLIRIP